MRKNETYRLKDQDDCVGVGRGVGVITCGKDAARRTRAIPSMAKFAKK